MACFRSKLLSVIDRNLSSSLILILCWFGITAPAASQTFFNWNGLGGNDLWSTPGNWVGGVAPTSGQNFALSFPSGAANLNMINDYTNPTWNRLDFNESGYTLSGNAIIFQQTSSAQLPAVTGNLNTNVSTHWILDDELTYSAGAGATSFVYTGTLSGSSALNLHGAFTLGSTGQINNAGAINITSNSGTVTVDGTIGSGGLLTIDSSRTLAGTGFINRNILMSGAANFSSSGTLTVNGNISVTNAPNNLTTGTLAANGDLEVSSGLLQTFVGSNLAGTGNLNLINSGSAQINGVVSSTKTINLTGAGNAQLYGNGTINCDINVDGDHFVKGNLTLNQNLNFSNTNIQAFLGGAFETLNVNGTATVNPGSTVRLEGTVSGSGSVVLESGSNLIMAGQLNTALTVRGTVNAIGGTNFNGPMITENAILIGLLNVQNTLTVQTSGITNLQAGADLNVQGLTTIQQGGLIVNTAATLDAMGDISVANNGVFTVNGQVNTDLLAMDDTTLLEGNGLVIGDMTLNGMIGPGNSAGTLKVDGNITLAPSSTVCIEIGGTGDGQIDIINGRGSSTISLNGSRLELSLINGFVPDAFHEFQFLRDFTAINGIFGNGDGYQEGGSRIHFADGSFEIVYQSNSIQLRDFQPIPEPGSVLLCGFLGFAILIGRRRLLRQPVRSIWR